MPFYNNVNRINSFLARFKTRFFYRFFFAEMGSRCSISKPLMIANPQHMHLGDRVVIRDGVRLEVVCSKGGKEPRLEIGNNVNIEQNVHIICGSKITIGNNVSITGGVAIVDVNHPYEDVNDPVKIGDRVQAEGNFVEIGDNVFIGYGAIILPSVKIGRNSIIGAYSVVTRDIPDFSVAAGSPCKIVKKYRFENKTWEKV